jgi:N-acetylglucosaminyldiphosphoundecaprenol N-acetyl-beta-D-mannosaminyltransferase
MKKATIFNSLISVGTYRAFIGEIFLLADLKIPSYVCFANVHMIVEAYKDESFQRLINEANILAPDGRPLSIFLRLTEGIKQDRVCGMDILPDLLKYAEVSGESVYFYGTTDELLKIIVQKAKTEFPALNIAGYYSPPFRTLSEEEDEAITQKITDARPDLVFVSLGCPKQEKWMAEHKNKLNACLLGLGQAFKVYAGTEKRLPKWMRSLSLEWVYRLYLEPGRLWKRYMYTNSYFLFLTARHLSNQLIKNINERFNRILHAA